MRNRRAKFIPVDLKKIGRSIDTDAALRARVMSRAGLDSSVGYSSDNNELRCGAHNHPTVGNLRQYYEKLISDTLEAVLNEKEVA